MAILLEDLASRYDLSESTIRSILRKLGIKVESGVVQVQKQDTLKMLKAISTNTLKEASVASCRASGSIKYTCLLQIPKSEPLYAIFRNRELIRCLPCIELESKHTVRVDRGVYLAWMEDDEVVEFHVIEDAAKSDNCGLL